MVMDYLVQFPNAAEWGCGREGPELIVPWVGTDRTPDEQRD
ncbi:MAG TPA: hypothetical protein VGH93_12370 [Solirubrobacteraceae bacterium]